MSLLSQLVGSVADPPAAAAEALELLASVIPFEAARVIAWDPIRQRHDTIACSGWHDYAKRQSVCRAGECDLLDRHVRDATVKEARPTLAVTDVALRLETYDGRYTGQLEFRPRADYYARAAKQALVAITTLLATVTDRLMTLSAVAQSLAPDDAAAIVTNQARLVELPGRSSGVHLAPNSPLVQAVAALLDDPRGTSRFLWVDEVGGLHRVRIERREDAAIVLERQVPAPHHLTLREIDVLTLLVEGHSNREIAGLLVISPRTVATHVEHILEKLDCRSRTAAAVRAVDHGLLRYPLPLANSGSDTPTLKSVIRPIGTDVVHPTIA